MSLFYFLITLVLSFQSCLHRILKYEVFLLLLFVSLVLFHKVHNAWSVFSSPYSSPFSLILHRFFWYFLSARSFWSNPFPVFLEYLTDGSHFLLYLSRSVWSGWSKRSIRMISAKVTGLLRMLQDALKMNYWWCFVRKRKHQRTHPFMSQSG